MGCSESKGSDQDALSPATPTESLDNCSNPMSSRQHRTTLRCVEKLPDSPPTPRLVEHDIVKDISTEPSTDNFSAIISEEGDNHGPRRISITGGPAPLDPPRSPAMVNPNDLFGVVAEEKEIHPPVRGEGKWSESSEPTNTSNGSPSKTLSLSRTSRNASLAGSSSSSCKSVTTLPAVGELRPDVLPEDYLKRLTDVAAAEHSSPMKRISTGLPRPEVPQAPPLPLHWASRFYPRKPGCLHDQYYNGIVVDNPFEVIVDTPAARRIVQTQELIMTRCFTGKAFAWPHPTGVTQRELILLPLEALGIEEVSVSEDATKIPKMRSLCRTLKQLLKIFRKFLMAGDSCNPALIASTRIVCDTACRRGQMRLASVLRQIEAIMVDIQCLQLNPAEFVTLVENSVGHHFLYEYKVDYAPDPDQPQDQPNPFIPPIEEYLKKRFLVDLSYCYQLAQKCLQEVSDEIRM